MKITGWARDASALAEFLEEPNLCRVASIDSDGRPHVVPAWFWWDGQRFWVGAEARDRKVANIAALAPDVIAAGNIGCIVQIEKGVTAAGHQVPVLHTIELLDWITGGPRPDKLPADKARPVRQAGLATAPQVERWSN